MTKSKQGFSLIMMLLIVSAFMFGTIGTYSAKAADDSPLDISSQTWTKYFMTFPLEGQAVYLCNKSAALNGLSGLKPFARTDQNVVVSMIFPAVQYMDKDTGITYDVMVSKATTLNFPASASWALDVRFTQNLKVNIRESYYNFFAKGEYDFSSVRVVAIFPNGHSITFSGRNGGLEGFPITVTGIALSSEEVPTDPNDPESPDFDLGDNGGIVPSPPDDERSLLRMIYDFLSGLFRWTLSYKSFVIIFWCIVGVLGLAVFMTLWRAIFGTRRQ